MRSVQLSGIRAGRVLRQHYEDQIHTPLVNDDDSDALDFLLVVSYTAGMIFKSRDILPALNPEASISNLICHTD
jgi:hypothetical protein